MRFRDALQSRAASLTEADRRIGNTLLTTSFGATGLTAAQLAAQANVHESTVVRFAQKLGYDGYPELRADLVRDFDRQAQVAGARGPALAADRDPSLEAVVAAQVALISDLPRLIPQSSIDAAADAIAGARSVLVLGRGLMTAPSVFMTRKLTLMGVTAVMSDQGGAEAVERAALLRDGDVLLMFAFNDEYAGFAPLIAALEQRGVRAVLVSDQAALFQSSQPSVVLPVPRRHVDNGVMGAITVVCYALQYALAARLPEQYRDVSGAIADLATASQLTVAGRYERIPGFGQSSPITTENGDTPR